MTTLFPTPARSVLLFAAVLGLSPLIQPLNAAERPNILIILADDK